MAKTNVTARTYPKRKRAEISYRESSSDESGVDDEYDTMDDEITTTPNKKLKRSGATVSSKPLPKRKIFPFMSLPAELRNQIYGHALIDPGLISLVSRTKRLRRTVERVEIYVDRHRRRYTQSQPSNVTADSALPALVPNLLLLNKAIYAEARPILYAGNSFAVQDTTAMHSFLATIGSKNRAIITDLTLRHWGYTKTRKALNHPALTMLADAVNLSRLNLDDDMMVWSEPRWLARQLYRNGFHWLEAVGAGKGKFDAGVDIIELGGRTLHRSGDALTLEESREEFRAELRRLLS